MNLPLNLQNIGQNANTRISSKGKEEKKNHESGYLCSLMSSFVSME